MEQQVFNTLTELEMREEREAMRNVPAGERIHALNFDAAKFLYILALGAKAKNIVEIGTGAGYATIWLALVAQKYGGKVITCEKNAAKVEEAKGYFEKAGLSNHIEVLVGDARETLRTYEEPVDLLFIDADELEYEAFFDVVYKQLNLGSLIVADGVITDEYELADYVSYVQNHPNVDSSTINIGDGLEVTVKITD